MNPRVQLLKQLVSDGHYVIDERAIADAMILRSMAARMLPELTFRCTASDARSFRLTRALRRPAHAHDGVAQPAA